MAFSAQPSAASWSMRRAALGLGSFFYCGLLLVSVYLLEPEWINTVVHTDYGWDYLTLSPFAGQQDVMKPKAKDFFAAYNAFTNESREAVAFCTPPLDEIRVTMNGRNVDDLTSLDVGLAYRLRIQSSCPEGIPGSGDFYETLLETPFYRSRINLYNQYDGTQQGEPLRLPAQLGEQGHPLRIRVFRLYREFEGIMNRKEIKAPFPDGKYTREPVVDVSLNVVGKSGQRAEDRPLCQEEDFRLSDWSGGFWWRAEESDEAWEYFLPKCKARLFSPEEASECLAGRKLVYFGDSTAQDMVRNTFWTLLGDAFPDHTDLPRDFPRRGHWNTTHPGHPDRWTSISYLFNGHPNLAMNRLGMYAFREPHTYVLHDEFFQELLDDGVEIDTFLINSGLHDAWVRWTPESFQKDFQLGWEYYTRKIADVKRIQQDKGQRIPKIVYRYSVTPPYHWDAPLATPMNPSSLEMINMLEREYLDDWNRQQYNGQLTYLDSFDLTWPWHFDGEMNSGPHYGRAPWAGTSKRLVDVMMVQLFFTRLCPDILA